MAQGNKGEIRIEEPDHRERAIIRRSAESRATVPDLDLVREADIAPSLSQSGSREAILVKACALALREVPRANGSYRDGRFELYSRVNVAISRGGEDPGGAPVIVDADRKSVAELGEELGALAGRARAGTLAAHERAGATFTLVDLEELGVLSATPPVVPPQAATLAVGSTREVPGSDSGASRQVATLTLSFDARILDMRTAAALAAAVCGHVAEPSGLLAL